MSTDLYAQPSFALVAEEELVQHEWVQFAQFVVFAAALAWAAWCKATGGWPVVARKGWFFFVSCYR